MTFIMLVFKMLQMIFLFYFIFYLISIYFKYFQKELPSKHENNHDTILTRAFSVRYNPKKMKKYEKDYTIFKNNEVEEQAELRVIN